jgi:putative transposase
VVSNTAPYRADMKGIVEQYFRLNNDRVLATLPGAVHEQQRGQPDYRLDARLNIHQLTTLLIRGALYHNQHHRLTDYPLNKQMLADGVEPYPLDLWNWGIQNRSGHLRSLPPDFIRLNLLPQGKASVTRKGIRFRGLQYTCPLAASEGWYVKAGHSGRWNVRVSYDPRLVDWLYLWHDDGRRVEVCSLVENTHMALFRGLDWDTVTTHFAKQRVQKQASLNRQQQGRAALNAHKDHIVDEAQAAYAETEGGSSAAKVRGIRGNRQAERTNHRRDEAWCLASHQASAPSNTQEDDGYIPAEQYLDLLRGKEGNDGRE